MSPPPDPSALSVLVSLLSALCDGQGGASLNLHVSVTPSDEVVELRNQVLDLHRQLDALDARYRRVEYRYGCEVKVNEQICDIAKRCGVDIPSRLRQPFLGDD